MNLLQAKAETEIAITNILFATDFSDISEAALPYVTALSLRYGSTVHCAHVLPDIVLLRPGAPDPAVFGSIYEDAHSVAQERMQQICSRLRGFPHHSYLRHGKICNVLSQIIEEQEIDLLILGTHGRTGLGKLVMGSVAEEIFRQAKCPVLTIGPRVPSTTQVREARHDRQLPPAQIKFHQILCATDLKSGAPRGPAYAFSLANEFRTKLTLLHVIEDYGASLHDRPRPIDTALRSLDELIPNAEVLPYRPTFVAQYGSASERILETAAECNADLIILGVHPAKGHLGAATHFGGSTAHRVVVGASCPVLTVRAQEHIIGQKNVRFKPVHLEFSSR